MNAGGGGTGSRGRGRGAPVASASSTQGSSFACRGGTRGGRGRGVRGRGGPQRPNRDYVENNTDSVDYVPSRPSTETLQSKKGTTGRTVELITNFYTLKTLTNFNLFHYHIEFKPDEERTEVRKKLFKIHESTFGACIFDGQSLFLPRRISFKELYSKNPYNQKKVQLVLKKVAEIIPLDPIFLQVYNIIFRNIMTSINLELIGRFHYDPAAKVTIPARKLEVWPGYITSVRNHENQIMLNVEVTHKVIRSDTTLDFIKNTKTSVRAGFDYKREVMKGLLGSVVLTRYNKKNYKIDDIKWDVTPMHEFEMKGGVKKTYKDYMKEQYNIVVTDMTQPMLVSLPKKKDFHRGANQPIYLIPELCQMTGLTEDMRNDFTLMRELTQYLTLTPGEKLRKGKAFIARWCNNKEVMKELSNWNIEISRIPTNCEGRVVPLDDIIVGPKSQDKNKAVKAKNTNGDWTNAFKSNQMLSTVPLKRWVVLFPRQCEEQLVEQLLKALISTSKSMNFLVEAPLMKHKVNDTTPASFSSAIKAIYTAYKKQVQLFMVVLFNNKPEVYSAIKRTCYGELGVASQCVVAKTLKTKSVVSISSRLAIQMNAKLGGEPWTVDIPIRNFMMIGYDVFHSPNKKVPSVGALVASVSDTCAKYVAITNFHTNRSELSANLCTNITKALFAYNATNKTLPTRIIMYRDGVGDGQLSYIYNTELVQIKDALKSVYDKAGISSPKFSFIVVTKRIHARIFLPSRGYDSGALNPPPGTIVDDVITLPERYDFFLISQNCANEQGTVSPTSYNVLLDEQGLDPDRMQRLTLKLCHLYYNYAGMIAVPAPCQFAHKLAYITGTSLNATAHESLQNLLYFL